MQKKLYLLTLLLAIFISACTRPPLPPPVVLFDQGHGQQFLIENENELDLSSLASIFKEQGFEVKSSTQPFTPELLEGVSAVVISGPFMPVNPTEIAILKKYLSDGGQLSVMMHIGSPVARLLNELGVAVSNSSVREQANLLNQDNPTDFFVKDLATHPLTKDLEQIIFYGTWAIDTQLPANIIAKTSPAAWVDLNKNKQFDEGDARQAFNVIVTGQLGHGQFVIFADDAIFQNRFITEENEILARNLAAWLKG